MINNLLQDIQKIYIVYGATDFRKQTYSLCNVVKQNYKMNPYDKSAYIFCNKKRNSIRVLCYDKNRIYISTKNTARHEKDEI